MSAPLFSRDPWPSLPYDELRPTVDHLHRLVQIGGKYTLNQPYEFNWGNIALGNAARVLDAHARRGRRSVYRRLRAAR